MYVKVFKSEYLSDDPNQFYCEMNLLVGISPRGIPSDEPAALVSH